MAQQASGWKRNFGFRRAKAARLAEARPAQNESADADAVSRLRQQL